MDPVTQGLLGAAAASAVFTKKLGRRAAIIGLAGGLLADADVLLSAWADPGHPQELHRHFTHALLFIPIGGILAAAPFYLRRWYRDRAWGVLGAATVAYATHGLLDSFTSYGTHLFWPFTQARSSWDLISIIDPVFTGVLLLTVLWGWIRSRARPAVIGLLVAACYLGWGAVQHGRAGSVLHRIASHRGHTVERIRVMPTFGNLVVWRGLYISNGRIYAMALRTPVFDATQVREGGSIKRFDPQELPIETPQRDRVLDILSRVDHFADGFLAAHRQRSDIIMDVRYSLDTAGFTPMWGVLIDPSNEDKPVAWGGFEHDRSQAIERLWEEMTMGGEGFRVAPSLGGSPAP